VDEIKEEVEQSIAGMAAQTAISTTRQKGGPVEKYSRAN